MPPWQSQARSNDLHDGPPIPLAEALGHWHDFYVLLGTASATMVGLLFVAATVGSGVFSGVRRSAQRVFLTASVVHFSSILAASLIILVPVLNWRSLGVIILGCGISGLTYCGLTWRDTVREGLSRSIDLEDHVWYIVLPILGYTIEVAAGIMLVLPSMLGDIVLALAMGILLVVGIHNAWDITIWSITRPRE
jgi:hypothetical protein